MSNPADQSGESRENQHLPVVERNAAQQPASAQAGASSPDELPKTALAQKPLEGEVIKALRKVYDPEIPVNLYDLGLIYHIYVDPDNAVHIRMTLTAPACPVADSLPPEVERRVEAIPEVSSANVELVWDPPWSREMMSEAARLALDM